MSQGSKVGVTRSSFAGPAGGAKPAAARKRLTILGATGSIGKSTLDLVAHQPDAFEIVALTAQSNVAELAKAARQTNARLAVIGDEALYEELKGLLAGTTTRVAAGRAAVIAAAAEPADCVLAAIVGAAGLEPTFAAVRQGRRVALANKECLVSAGDVFMAAASRRQRALGSAAGACRGRAREHRNDRADRLGRAVSHLGRRAVVPRHTRGGAAPSQLVDGGQDYD
jgi:hypothetical protein